MRVGQRRARGSLVAMATAVFVLLAAACGGGSAGSDGGDPSTTAAASSTSPTDAPPSTPDAAPALYTVEPPGPRAGALVGDDLLIVSADTIPDDVVDQITSLRWKGQDGVSAWTQLSVGQISVENKLYNLAAVEAAEYRRFTVQDSADFQEQWDRVAGGEMAVRLELQDKLPLDEDGYLAVGSGEETHPVHIGAYGQQVGTIDGVVNQEWGEVLGLPTDNALLLNTGGVSPQVVREQIEKAMGEQALSITALDIVAETGIDPDTFQTVQPVGSFGDAVGVFRYTPIGGGRVQPDPAWVREYIVTETLPILGQLTCNKYMMPQLRAALLEVQRRGLADEIKYHVGCYYPRFIAGTTTLSNHSFGLAIDINSRENQRGTVGEMNREVVAIFKLWGFAWGGDWAYTDPMHFELERIVNPG